MSISINQPKGGKLFSLIFTFLLLGEQKVKLLE